MTVLYAVAVALGTVAVIAWVAFGVIGTADVGGGTLDPEARLGPTGRAAVAGVTGFGMAGMSATFAGWNGVLALAAAVVGAAVMAIVALRLGPSPVDE